MTKIQDSIVSDVRYANGSRIPQAAGSAVIVVIPNTSTIPAAWSGTLLPLAANVLDVYTNGCGRRAYDAVNGHYTNIGTRTTIRVTSKDCLFRAKSSFDAPASVVDPFSNMVAKVLM